MACGSCVQNLALKLIEHHRANLDFVRALELAEKGVERYESREPEVKSGNPTDYTQACTQGTCVDTYGCTKEGLPCTLASQCADGSCTFSGSCGCPASLPNSSLISNCSVTCSITGTCARCVGPTGEKYCTPNCTVSACGVSGTCGYNCDAGYVWNGVACVLPSVEEELLGDGLASVTN